MTLTERLDCYRLQLEGLASWPDGPEKEMMRVWVQRRIDALTN